MIDDFEYSEQIAYQLTPRLSNNPNTSQLRMNKYEMQRALAKDNINYIKTCKISEYSSTKFNSQRGVVLKPFQETCSVTGIEFFNNITEFNSLKDIEKIPSTYIVQKELKVMNI